MNIYQQVLFCKEIFLYISSYLSDIKRAKWFEICSIVYPYKKEFIYTDQITIYDTYKIMNERNNIKNLYMALREVPSRLISEHFVFLDNRASFLFIFSLNLFV